MTAQGQSLFRKALRLFSAGVPMQLASDELFAIRPGASIPALMAYGPMGFQDEGRKPYRMLDGGIAEIAITGILSRYPSMFRMFGCSSQPTTGELIAAVNRAADDEAAAKIMIYVVSPGGVSGLVPELCDAVAEAAKKKPVHAYTDDACCSAGFWAICKASRISAGRGAELGGIGCFSVLLDARKAAGIAGLQFHIVSSGPYKGAGAEPGAGLTPEQLAYFQGRVRDSAAIFRADVATGRGLDLETAQELADGSCHIAARAVELGLCDAVGTYAEALAVLAETDASAPSTTITPPAPLEPEDYPEDPEEEAMSMPEKKPEAKAPPAAAATPAAKEDAGLLEKIKALLTGKEATAAAPSALPSSANALTAEDIDKRIKAEVDSRMQAAEVDRDLQALAGKVPPAVLANAETRAILLEAKAKGPERYKAALGLVAGNDASALLGGPIAAAEVTGEGRAGLMCSAKEQALLAQMGVTAEDIARVESKYLRVN